MKTYAKILTGVLIATGVYAAAPAFVDSFINTQFSKEETQDGTTFLLNQDYKPVGTYQNKNRIAFAPYDSSLEKAGLPAESLLIYIDSTGAFTCAKKEIWGDSIPFKPTKKQEKKMQKPLDEIVN